MLYEVITNFQLRAAGANAGSAPVYETGTLTIPDGVVPALCIRHVTPARRAPLANWKFVITSYSIHYTKLYDDNAGDQGKHGFSR